MDFDEFKDELIIQAKKIDVILDEEQIQKFYKYMELLLEWNEKIGYRIRKAQLEKVPFMLVVGDKEQETNTVAVRSREDGDIGSESLKDFIKRVRVEK